MIITIAGNFCWCTFGSRALSRNIRGFKYSRFKARKPHPPITLHAKYWCVGVYPSTNYYASKNANFAPKISRRYANTVISVGFVGKLNLLSENMQYSARNEANENENHLLYIKRTFTT